MLTWAAMTSVATNNLQIVQQVCEEDSLGMECDDRVTALYTQLKEAKELGDVHALTYGREGLMNSLLNEIAIEANGDLSDPQRQLSHTLQETQEALGNANDASSADGECALCKVIDTQEKSE